MNQIAQTSQRSPAQIVRADIDSMSEEFGRALLGTAIPQEKFVRVVMTAVLSDPAVLAADRKSLIEAATRAAQDGLLPDKREGAFVVFGKVVQWMPMIGGIIKKIHQSGDVSLITAKVVYGGDNYKTWVDDGGEHVIFEPAELPDYDTIRQVFAMAKTKDGTVYVEALTPRDIEKIRSVSRSKNNGPWVQWWEEMAKKSAIRRLAKRLPLSAEIHDMLQRDNEMYDLSRAPEPRPSLLERLAGNGKAPAALAAPEGFSRSHVAAETAALSSEAGSGQQTEHEPPAPAPVQPATGSEEDRPVPHGPPAADLSDDESDNTGAGSIEAREEPGALPAPADDHAWLVSAAKQIWAATGKGEQELVIAIAADLRKTVPASIGKATRDKFQSIVTNAKKVCFDELDAGDALELIAGIAGVEPKEIVAL